jgi:hypothetical protein
MIPFDEAKRLAIEHDACQDAIDAISSMTSWDEFWQHPQASEWAYWYASEVIEDRWPEAEPHLMKEPTWAYFYAFHVIKGRWMEAEPHIIKELKITFWYASNVIKERWLEAEPIIKESFYWPYYVRDVMGEKE